MTIFGFCKPTGKLQIRRYHRSTELVTPEIVGPRKLTVSCEIETGVYQKKYMKMFYDDDNRKRLNLTENKKPAADSVLRPINMAKKI